MGQFERVCRDAGIKITHQRLEIYRELAQTGDHPDAESVFQIESEWVKGPEDVVPLALFLAAQPLVGPSAQSFSLMRRDNG